MKSQSRITVMESNGEIHTFDIEHVILGTLVSLEATATLKWCVKLLITIDYILNYGVIENIKASDLIICENQN